MPKMIDLRGKTFGRVTVLATPPTRSYKGNLQWKCRCSCSKNTEFWTLGENLRKGHTKSCGCLVSEVSRKNGLARQVHGEGSQCRGVSTEYRIWGSMCNRCFNPKNQSYKNYGGRGITVCPQWLGQKGYQQFLLDMGRRPSHKHSIDRYPNNNGDYEPGNCRWATTVEQSENKRNTQRIQFQGESKTISEWAQVLGLKKEVLRSRLSQSFSMTRAISQPVLPTGKWKRIQHNTKND